MAFTTRSSAPAITLVETIVVRLRDQIITGELPHGSRLLSVRKAADAFGVSKNTAVEAYDRLASAGLITAHKGSGFAVTYDPDTQNHKRPKHVAEAVDIASLLSAQLEQSFQIRVGDGRPPPEWTEQSEIKRHLMTYGRSFLTDSDAYGSALGFPPLRQIIAKRLQNNTLQVQEKNILLSFGANHALDLIIRGFLSPGDTVLVDDPGYYPLFAKLALAQIKTVGVRRTPEGPSVPDFIEKLKTERPKMFFTQSLGHNPMGGSTSLPVAHAILLAATNHDITIVEDEPFGDLPFPSPHRLATLDQLNRVITVGTFAKTLSASLRSGFIVAREDIIASLVELKMLTTVNSSGHIERLLHRLLSDGHYDRHLKRLWQRIETASTTVQTKLDQAGWHCFSNHVGGYYKYLLLPSGVSDIELSKAGAKESIFIAPGSVFCIDKQSSLAKGIRINIARANDPRFYDFLLRSL